MASLKATINQKFPITNRGPISFFLNMHFTRDRVKRTIDVHQMNKIDKLIEEFLPHGKPAKIPADPNITLTKAMCPTNDEEIARMATFPYRRLVGILLYIAITARPDIMTAVSSAGRYSHNPGQMHWDGLQQIIRYLIGTRDKTLTLGGIDANLKVNAFSDADWIWTIDALGLV
jgi:hypothetical protein